MPKEEREPRVVTPMVMTPLGQSPVSFDLDLSANAEKLSRSFPIDEPQEVIDNTEDAAKPEPEEEEKPKEEKGGIAGSKSKANDGPSNET